MFKYLTIGTEMTLNRKRCERHLRVGWVCMYSKLKSKANKSNVVHKTVGWGVANVLAHRAECFPSPSPGEIELMGIPTILVSWGVIFWQLPPRCMTAVGTKHAMRLLLSKRENPGLSIPLYQILPWIEGMN